MNRNEYEPPLPEQVKTLRDKHGISTAQVADLACVKQRVVQAWEAPTSSPHHRYPSESAWTLLNIRLREIPVGALRRRASK